MGNSSSSSDSEEELHVEYKQDEDNLSDGELETDKDAMPNLDLHGLFEAATLRIAASKVKDDIPENVIQQHQHHLLRWLEDRQQRNEETVFMAQFCDVLMNRSVSREDCVQAFQQFDSEGDGTADVSAMLEALRASNGELMYGELGYVVRTLQACSLTPGFIDVYSEDKQVIGQHGARILNFLLRNRVPTSSLPFPILNGFNNTTNMRLGALTNHFHKLKDTANRHQEEGMLSDGEELKPITRCTKAMEVSTNKSDVYRLVNGDFSSYWQSDGAARSHWVRLRMRNNVVMKHLSVSVAASDQSYMPQVITVSVGKNCHSLREIKEVRIPSHITGDVTVLENCKTFYPIIQLNIKRCHSDGCDTRLHGLKTLGYRVVKEQGVSVMDASAAWYLQVLASTATATIPIAPNLRDTIMAHTKTALKHMCPLSLSPASSEKPPILSHHVLKQMDAFLADIAVNTDGVMTCDGLYVLLAFNLARGHVAGILRSLHYLQDNMDLEVDAGSLLKSLDNVRDSFWKKQGTAIQLSLAGCDGGQKEDSSSPENVLSGNWTATQLYLSADGKTKVNMFFKAPDFVQLTKLRIKVDKGPRGPKRGFVFVYRDKEEFDLKKHVTRFEGYDSWTATEYNFCSKVRSSGIGGKPDNPVAYFMVEDDWDEVEITLDVCPVGQYVLVKFLEPRQNSAERLGVVGIKFHGFQRNHTFVHVVSDDAEKQCMITEKTQTVDSKAVFSHTLNFLVALARDQVALKNTAGPRRPQFLDMSDITVELIWKLYSGFENRYCQNLMLQLLHALFPFLSSNKSADKEASETLFKHLCSVVDTTRDEMSVEGHLVAVAKQVIVDGAAVFFPDKEARRKQLFNMMTDINATTELASISLIFQSLCQFFSSVDPSGLLDLPPTPNKDFDCEPVLAVMETLMSVAYREYTKLFDDEAITEQSSHLVHLLCSLQTSLLAWCYQHTDTDNKEHSEIAQSVLVKYALLVSSKTTQALEDLNRHLTSLDMSISPVQGASSAPELPNSTSATNTKDKNKTNNSATSPSAPELENKKMTSMLQKLDATFLGTAIRQMVAIVTLMSEPLSSSTRVQLLANLQPIVIQLKKISVQMKQYFFTVESDHWRHMEGGEVVLRTWDVESAHNYENNQHHTQIYSCPGASTFVVEFDPRCETEKRYDYLEFTDSRGVKTRFDQKVGVEKWPTNFTFKGGHRLQFLFHSDSSNNEWGYKFKVTAKGCPDVPLCWLFDLQLSIAKLCGSLCGATLNSQLVLPKTQAGSDKPDEKDVDMLRSELWTTLFRGGYMVGKLQRSFSGKHVAVEDESHANMFLWSLIEDKEGAAHKLLQRCRQHSTFQEIGGEEVNEAVISVFAALLWHTQTLREDVEKYAKLEPEDVGRLPEGIFQAFNAAESLRTILIELRQKWKIALENDSSQKTSNPVTQCKEKAVFLLKFAGLSKLHLRPENKTKLSRQISRHSRIEKFIKLDSILEKYPSFRLVIEFVRDPNWSQVKVEEMLKERSAQAHAVAEVYKTAAEFIRIMSDKHIFQVATVLFLQELLAHQNQFAKHYADGLDGCGLDLESKVRRSYYMLIRRLIDSITSVKRTQLPKSVMTAHDYIVGCTLHLLDVNWQLYDLSFLVDVKLSQFYIDLAKSSVSMRMKVICDTDEKEEETTYKKDMEWLAECKKGFYDWYDKSSKGSKEEKKAMQMFVAKFCDLLEVEISCDGCSATLPGRRYRCLQCQDMDLCATCYAGGVKPAGTYTGCSKTAGEHTDDHEMVHMMYKCDECQAFIVGTRIHCGVCEDFDLCYGCFKNKHFPSGHTPEHEITKFPTVKLKLSKDCNTSLQSYIHQHVWLSFSSLALSMANIIYSSSRHLHDVDADYIKACVQLHNQCIELANKCLMQVSMSDEFVDDDSEEATLARQDEAFAFHSQERIMGLLGAMIPPENMTPISDDVHYTFSSEQFLQLLFTIARGESGHESNTQHLAMGLIGQLLQRTTTTCRTADNAVAITTSIVIPPDSPEGSITAEFLFSFGATCLERSGLEWANSMANILQRLFSSQSWREVLLAHLTKCIHTLTSAQSNEGSGTRSAVDYDSKFLLMADEEGLVTREELQTSFSKKGLSQNTINSIVTVCLPTEKVGLDHYRVAARLVDLAVTQQPDTTDHAKTQGNAPLHPELASIFALFVIAGFPEVLSIGAQVKYTDIGTEMKDGVVLKHFPEKNQNQTLVIDKKSRKRRSMKDEFVECVSHDIQALDRQHIIGFIKVIKDIAAKVKAVEKVSVESLWVLALSLKALLRTIQCGQEEPVSELFSSDFVQCVVHLAGQGTGFSKQWLLKDLEILSLMLYTRDHEKAEESGAAQTVETSSGKSPNKDKDKAKDKEGNAEDCADPLSGLDDTAKLCFQTLNEHLNVGLSVLRAIYDMHGQNTNALLVAVHDHLEGDSFVPSEKMLRLAKRWESPGSTLSDKAVDMGMQLTPVTKQSTIAIETAVDEPSEETQRLIMTNDSDAWSDTLKQRKTRSANLLKKELDSQGRSGSRDFLIKVNMGMGVLYARQLLMTLLADWPSEGPEITAQLIGCKDNAHVPFVLDLLNRTESKEIFQTVVEKVIKFCKTECLVPIATTACQFMEEVNLSTVIRESDHNYKNNTNKEEKVHIPGATVLSIRFDSRCCTEDACDELVMASNQDYTHDKHIFSGPRDRWIDFEIPGERLYYKFTSDCSNNDWGYKFTVTGGKLGRFDTGYMILNSVLSMPHTTFRLLPLNELWSSLVYVACKQTGEQRLKSLQLLLKIMQAQFRLNGTGELSVELAQLRPLWQLYSKLSDDHSKTGKETITSPVTRALTEFFLVAENLAMDWGVGEQYMAALLDDFEIHNVIYQGILNIGAISLMINYNNKALEALKALKDKKAVKDVKDGGSEGAKKDDTS